MLVEEKRRVVLRKKDLNARGNGLQITRRVRLPGGYSGWASDYAQDIEGSWSSGTYLASERRCEQTGLLPVGTLIIEFQSEMRSGRKSGSANYIAGVIVGTEDGRLVRSERGISDRRSDKIKWGLSTRRFNGSVQVESPEEGWLEI